MTEALDADLIKDLRGLGKLPTFDGNATDYQEFHCSFPNPHEFRQCGLSRVDGQVRSRMASNHFGSRVKSAR